MSRLRFRNIDARPEDLVETWPTEGFVAALERGGLSDWARIDGAIRKDPWGPAARRLESALAAVRPYGSAALLEGALERARQAAAESERSEVAKRVKLMVESSGLTRSEFAQAVGTSPSRLSTYMTGKVVPSAAMLVRMERLANRGRW